MSILLGYKGHSFKEGIVSKKDIAGIGHTTYYLAIVHEYMTFLSSGKLPHLKKIPPQLSLVATHSAKFNISGGYKDHFYSVWSTSKSP